MMLIGLNEPLNTPLKDSDILPSGVDNLRLAALMSLVTLGGLYLPRASSLERLLPSAIASIALLITVGLAGNGLNDYPTIALTGVSFVVTGAWLTAQG